MKIDQENTDPAYWEKILQESGCLNSEEEQKGIPNMISLDADPVDDEIAAKLAEEGDHIEYLGSPTSFVALVSEVRDGISALKGTKGEVAVAIHTSCTNGKDTIIVFQPGGLQKRFNTHNTVGYSRRRFGTLMCKQGVSVKEY